MKQYYYINTAGQQAGPLSLDELQKIISPSTMIWCEGMENWQPANTVINIGTVPPPAPPAYITEIQQPPCLDTIQTHAKPENLQTWIFRAIIFYCILLAINIITTFIGEHRYQYEMKIEFQIAEYAILLMFVTNIIISILLLKNSQK